MSYLPEDLPSTAICMMEGCDWHGGGTCCNCGARLRCMCGRFVRERDLETHETVCPTAHDTP